MEGPRIDDKRILELYCEHISKQPLYNLESIINPNSGYDITYGEWKVKKSRYKIVNIFRKFFNMEKMEREVFYKFKYMEK